MNCANLISEWIFHKCSIIIMSANIKRYNNYNNYTVLMPKVN